MFRGSPDIEEEENDYLISVEVPSVDQSNVAIQLDGRSLVISGEKSQEKKEESASFHRVERSYGSFRRVLSLPENADGEQIDATFANGVLKIKVAKRAGAKSDLRKIEIKSS